MRVCMCVYVCVCVRVCVCAHARGIHGVTASRILLPYFIDHNRTHTHTHTHTHALSPNLELLDALLRVTFGGEGGNDIHISLLEGVVREGNGRLAI